MNLEELMEHGLSKKVCDLLRRYSTIRTLEDIDASSDAEILITKGIGRALFREIRHAANRGRTAQGEFSKRTCHQSIEKRLADAIIMIEKHRNAQKEAIAQRDKAVLDLRSSLEEIEILRACCEYSDKKVIKLKKKIKKLKRR